MPASPTVLERLPKSRATVTVTFSVEEAAKAEEQALRALGQDMNIKGFRPGHAPLETVRARITPEALTEQTVRTLMHTTLPALIDEHKITPVIPPKVEIVTKEPLVLKVLFIERPTVTIDKPDTITVAKKDITVDPKDIERTVEGLRREHRRKTTVDRAAKENDEVIIDFSATDADGKDIHGLTGTDEAVAIGSKTFLPGFEEALQGVKAGEEKSFTLTLPEKFPVEALRNTKANFHAKVKAVEAVELPELTDALVQKLFNVPTVTALRTQIETSIRMQEEQMERMDRERTLLETIRTHTKVDLADELLEQEVGDMVEEWASRLEKQHTTIEEVLKKQGKTVEQADKELKEQALERWKLRLGLQKLIELKQVTVTEEEVQKVFLQSLQQMPEDQRAQALANLQEGGTAYQELRWRALVEKTIEILLA